MRIKIAWGLPQLVPSKNRHTNLRFIPAPLFNCSQLFMFHDSVGTGVLKYGTDQSCRFLWMFRTRCGPIDIFSHCVRSRVICFIFAPTHCWDCCRKRNCGGFSLNTGCGFARSCSITEKLFCILWYMLFSVSNDCRCFSSVRICSRSSPSG